MRPLKLTISAFGPYANEVTIPMDELGDKGLYLITGDTGAGKTTIFDAICYALYGEASGKNRNASMLRSKYAEDNRLTFVELSFEHNGKEYRVERKPEQERAAKRGDGRTKEVASAVLYRPDGSIVSKLSDVTPAVEEILGLNKSQFTQIAMLAQGDFLKLLLANTEERQQIFRRIFNTGFYDTLQKALEEKRKEVAGRVSDTNKSISQYVDEIKADEDNVLNLEVIKAREGKLTSLDIMNLLEKLIDEDETFSAQLSEKLKKIEESIKEVVKDSQIGLNRQETQKLLEEEKIKLESKSPLLIEAREGFKKAEKELLKKDNLLKLSAEISATLPDYQLHKDCIRKIDDLLALISKTENEISEKSNLLDADNEEIKGLKLEKASLEKAGEKLAKLNADLSRKEDTVGKCISLQNLLNEYNDLLSELEKAQNVYLEDSRTYDLLKEKYDSFDKAFRDGQAGILAEKLEEGMACPVCGSTRHPNLAHKPETIPGEDELKAAKAASERALKKANDSSSKAGALKATVERIEKDLLADSKELMGMVSIDKVEKELNILLQSTLKEIEKLKETIVTEEKNRKRKETLDTEIPQKEELVQNITEEINILKNSLTGLKTQKIEKDKQLAEIKKNLKFESKEAAEGEIDKTDREAQKLQEAFDATGNALTKINNEIIESKTRIDNFEKQIKVCKEVNLEQCLEKEKQLEEEKAQLDRSIKTVLSRIDTNKEVRKNLSDKVREIGESETRLQWLKALADTANGKLSGKEKIMLETYVQTTYFDRIIRRANIRLLTMSSNQYELIRQSESDNFRSQSGLNLEVIDHYNGSRRSVKTLSGGESFMASLSLALGLSDEVQENASQNKIDTMFVDEGFGSLDPDSLALAYNALAGLTEGNKLVGIISHVGELKEKIDKQIVVTKEKSGGSKINLLV